MIAHAIANPQARDRVLAFLDKWQSLGTESDAQTVALALLTAAEVEKHYRNEQTIDLVWTGPDSHVIPLRRTDQALLQLIDDAQQTLMVVSFAVYKVQSIADALVRAAGRSVSIAICLETPDASEGKIAFDTIKALGKQVSQSASLYIWPNDQRPRSPDGKHGSLHAKVAIADSHEMLISSANLTEYAMTLNMEMGVLIRGGELPTKTQQHFEQLIQIKSLLCINR